MCGLCYDASHNGLRIVVYASSRTSHIRDYLITRYNMIVDGVQSPRIISLANAKKQRYVGTRPISHQEFKSLFIDIKVSSRINAL
jgi:hypothetical protein